MPHALYGLPPYGTIPYPPNRSNYPHFLATTGAISGVNTTYVTIPFQCTADNNVGGYFDNVNYCWRPPAGLVSLCVNVCVVNHDANDNFISIFKVSANGNAEYAVDYGYTVTYRDSKVVYVPCVETNGSDYFYCTIYRWAGSANIIANFNSFTGHMVNWLP